TTVRCTAGCTRCRESPDRRRVRAKVGPFRKGDRVVHPRHGAAVVDDVIERETLGERRSYLKLCLPHGLTLMVPVATTDDVGVRRAAWRKAGDEGCQRR